MASKLFHTVVAFGITLGAASIGCSAPSSDETTSDTASIVSREKGATSDKSEGSEAKAPAKAGDAKTDAASYDRYCEPAWPTTKGGPRPEQSQECIDPKDECGEYPGTFFNWDECVYADDVKTCDATRGTVWMFCKSQGVSSAPRWTCPAGTILATQCVWPTETGAPVTIAQQGHY